MRNRFYPTDYFTSTYVINFEKLYNMGYRGVIFDVDNTLVEHDAPADDRAKELIARLKSIGYKVCFLSNNGEERVKMFNDAVGCQYIFKAGKPLAKGYKSAMELMGTSKEETFFVGDQIFTDVYGAKLAGIHSILVKPIHPKEEIQIVLKRYLEKIVLYFYKKSLQKKK